MILINDTNIWIDLKYVNLVDEVFKLPYDIGVPNILFDEELKDTDSEILLKNNINILEMTIDEMLETSEMFNNTTGVSFNDLTTLVVSHKRNCTLVTGDGNLRKLALSKNVNLRGSIWLLDELVEHKIISKHKAYEACNTLLNSSRRLPQNELKKRIQKWKD